MMQRTTKNPKGSSPRRNLNRYVQADKALFRVVEVAPKEYEHEAIDESTHAVSPVFASGWEFALVRPRFFDQGPVQVYDPVSGVLVLEADETMNIQHMLRAKIKEIGGFEAWRRIIDFNVRHYGLSPSWHSIRPSFTQQSFPN